MDGELNWKGNWITRDKKDLVAHIEKRLNESMWLGYVEICGYRIATLWDKMGSHFTDSRLDLMERIREGRNQ
jgi:hypothetical protein